MIFKPVTQPELDTALDKIECACGVKVANVIRRALWQLQQRRRDDCECKEQEPLFCSIEPGKCET